MNTLSKIQKPAPALSSIFNDLFADEFINWSDRPMQRSMARVPAVNISENDDQWQLELAAPGMKREDFKVELNQDVLRISSVQREEKEEKAEKYSVQEYSYSSFQRTFRLPEHLVDGDKVNAKYEDGVLRVSIPKKEEAKPQPPRMIEIG